MWFWATLDFTQIQWQQNINFAPQNIYSMTIYCKWTWILLLLFHLRHSWQLWVFFVWVFSFSVVLFWQVESVAVVKCEGLFHTALGFLGIHPGAGIRDQSQDSGMGGYASVTLLDISSLCHAMQRNSLFPRFTVTVRPINMDIILN